MIIVKNRLSGLILANGYAAIAIWPFVFIAPELPEEAVTDRLLNHERIHLRQQVEMLVIPFFICYLFEYLLGLLVYRSHDSAYRQISFEKEAYQNEGDLSYLKKRKFWSWLNY